jgi:hypothetical protein
MSNIPISRESIYNTYFNGSNSISSIIGSGNPKEINDLGKFLDIHRQSLDTALTRSQGDILSDEVLAAYQEVKQQAATTMIQNFLDLYMTATNDNSDINLRLGKVTGARSNKMKLPSTDANGRLYTRSSFKTVWDIKDFSIGWPTTRRITYANMFFPPYKNNQSIYSTNFASPTSLWSRITSGSRGTDTFNLTKFKADRLLFTYREPAWKAINDNISFLQWVFEGVSGIVSTYLTEWDLSMYIQEGILNAVPNRNGKLISLLFRMKQDNPMSYQDDRAYVFGAINAMTSKRSLNKVYDIPSYPLSAYWLPYNLDFWGGIPSYYYTSNIASFNSGNDLLHQLEWWDKRGAALSGWSDLTPNYWKIGYTTPEDSLSNIDAQYFTDEEVDANSAIASAGTDVSVSSGGSKWYEKMKPSSGSAKKSAIQSRANKYITASDLMSNAKSAEYKHFTMPIGVATHNPFMYGGPHGQSYAPKSIQSFFQVDSNFCRDTPRIEPVTDYNLKNAAQYYNGVNCYYRYISSDPSDEGLSSSQLGISETNFPYSFSLFKNGIQEKRAVREWSKRLVPYVTVHSDYYWWDGDYGYYGYRGYNYRWNYWNYFPYRGRYIVNPMNGQGEWVPLWWSYHNHHYGWFYDSNYGGYRWGWYVLNYGYTYEWQYTIADRYLLHSRPHDDFNIEELKVYDYELHTSWGNGLWGTINRWFSWWSGSRPNITVVIRSVKTRFQLRLPNSWPQVVKIFGNSNGVSPMRIYTSAECDVADNMVRNARWYSQNYLTFFGGRGSVASSVFRAGVSMKEYQVIYYVRVRYKHRCHHDHRNEPRVGYLEYIDVDMSNIPFAMCDMDKVPFSNYGRSELWSGAEPTVQRTHASIYSYFEEVGGVMMLRGNGILSSIAGANPSIDELFGNGYANMLRFAGSLNDTRLFALQYPAYQISSYNRNYMRTIGGYKVYATGGFEDYVIYNLPPRLNQSLIRAFTTATFYKAGDKYAYNVSIDTPFRLLYAQLCWQRSFLSIAKNQLIDNLDWKSVNTIIRELIEKTVVCAAGLHKTSSQEYNYYLDKAMTTFGVVVTKVGDEATISSVPSNKVQSLKDGYKASLAELITIYDSLIATYEPICCKPLCLWTFNEIKTCFDSLHLARKAAYEYGTFTNFFYQYLNILYEYRKYFFSKRFNKMDGSYYMFRHLEATLTLASQAGSTEPLPTLKSLVAEEIPVALYRVDNSIVKKVAAVASGVALDKDRTQTLYVEVEYASEKEYADDQKDMLATKRTEPEVVKISSGAYAYKPVDGAYQLLSKEWTDNENNKKFNTYIGTLTAEEQAEKTRKNIFDYDKCVRTINWGDESGKTPILYNNTYSVDANKLIEYKKITAALDQSTEEALCYARKTVDYWTIEIPAGERPRTAGYLSAIKLVPKAQADANAAVAIEGVLSGYMSNTLYPITEKQAKLAVGQAEQLDNVYSALLSGVIGYDS